VLTYGIYGALAWLKPVTNPGAGYPV